MPCQVLLRFYVYVKFLSKAFFMSDYPIHKSPSKLCLLCTINCFFWSHHSHLWQKYTCCKVQFLGVLLSGIRCIHSVLQPSPSLVCTFPSSQLESLHSLSSNSQFLPQATCGNTMLFAASMNCATIGTLSGTSHWYCTRIDFLMSLLWIILFL